MQLALQQISIAVVETMVLTTVILENNGSAS